MDFQIPCGMSGKLPTWLINWSTPILAGCQRTWLPKWLFTIIANLVGSIFNCPPVGIVAPGAVADLIFVDYQPYTPLTTGNLPWQIVFGFNESMITTTMVNGKILMKDRKLVTLDEEKITYEARKLAPDVWARYEAQF